VTSKRSAAELQLIQVGMIYALLDVVGEVLGRESSLRQRLYRSLRYRETLEPITSAPLWFFDRFEAALDDFYVFDHADRADLKARFFGPSPETLP
jgi:hypothetical protein